MGLRNTYRNQNILEPIDGNAKLISRSIFGNWDFNEVAVQEEKAGRRPVGAASSSTGIMHFIASHGMIGLGYRGNKSRWSKKIEAKANIKERLDRGVANIHGESSFQELQ